MRVFKIKTKDGAVFYSQPVPQPVHDWLDALEHQANKYHGGVESFEAVEMTRREYDAIPATVQSARLFEVR